MKEKTRAAIRCFTLAASVATALPAQAMLVLDIPNFIVNKLSLIQLKLIRNELHNPEAGTVNYNTLEINKSVQLSYENNYAIDADFTWIFNNGGEIIPIPKLIQGKLKDILNNNSVEKYTAYYRDADGFGDFPEGGYKDNVAFEGSRSRKAANDALVSSVNLEREAIGSEFTQLGSLSARIKEGQGQGHQLQVANALASTQVHQMMKLRSMMVVSEAARAAEAQVAAEKDARAIAVSNHMRAGLGTAANQSVVPRPKY
jgi:conjugal transfer/entry exclusion protein